MFTLSHSFSSFCSSAFLSLSLLTLSFTSCSCSLTPSTVFFSSVVFFRSDVFGKFLYFLLLCWNFSFAYALFSLLNIFTAIILTSLSSKSLISISLKSVPGVLCCLFVWNIHLIFFVFLFFSFFMTLYVSFHAFDEIATSSRQRWNHVEDETYPSTWP